MNTTPKHATPPKLRGAQWSQWPRPTRAEQDTAATGAAGAERGPPFITHLVFSPHLFGDNFRDPLSATGESGSRFPTRLTFFFRFLWKQSSRPTEQREENGRPQSERGVQT